MIEMGYEENDPAIVPEIKKMADGFPTSWRPCGSVPF